MLPIKENSPVWVLFGAPKDHTRGTVKHIVRNPDESTLYVVEFADGTFGSYEANALKVASIPK